MFNTAAITLAASSALTTASDELLDHLLDEAHRVLGLLSVLSHFSLFDIEKWGTDIL